MGKPEPLYVDGEAGYKFQCDKGEGVYVISAVEVGCTVSTTLEGGGNGAAQAQLPVVVPES